MELGFTWPPSLFNFLVIDPFSVPLLNSVLLLSSGATVTCCHHYLINKSHNLALIFIFFTLILGFLFLGIQGIEYSHSILSVNRTIFGSCFFLLTGFHGLHVTIGAIFLRICFFRFIFHRKSNFNHTGFEAAS